MAIFNYNYIMTLLNEKTTKEEYARRSFKKKYKFKPGTYNNNIGTAIVDGKKYQIDMDKNNYYIDYEGNKEKRTTSALTNNEDGKITLDKKFFKLKGSNNNERRDAILQHEIGHHKNETIHRMDNRPRKIEELNKANKIAERYDKSNLPDQEHTSKEEFLADRYAADKTSKSAMKKGLRNIYSLNRKDANRKINKLSLQLNKKQLKKLKSSKAKSRIRDQIDMNQRFKALDDNELKKQYDKYERDE